MVDKIIGINNNRSMSDGEKYDFWFREDCIRLDEKKAWLSEQIKEFVILKQF
jgi:hypothetical protein